MSASLSRKRIQLTGLVQGVGFRPFVFRLAHQHGVRGWVRNHASGLLIEAEAHAANLERFLAGLREDAPPLARIESLQVQAVPPRGEDGFQIHASPPQETPSSFPPPDLALCADCQREIAAPGHRRAGYAFTSCTQCGPRFSILRAMPYDRTRTAMEAFVMCGDCQTEYDNPSDRRFHAQTNACPACGPQLILEGPAANTAEPLQRARHLLAEGKIIALKGLGGFQLACDASNASAVQRLRLRKHRPDKPFALMAPDLDTVRQFCDVSDADRHLLLSPQRPIVLLPQRPGAALCSAVAPNQRTLGVMLPSTPLHALLFAGAPYRLLVMTSGNLSEEPMAADNQEARSRLATVADAFLLHDRDILQRVDDSVARVVDGCAQILRRARGYAPEPVELPAPGPETLACGAHLKNTLCLTWDRYAVLSPHIGDLDNLETWSFFEQTLAQMQNLLGVRPRLIAHDLHPLYRSTRFALACGGAETVGVQHHHAHLAACMVEHRLREKVIGVIFDGAGLGTDGQIWGGEFLLGDLEGFERRAHLRYVPLAGGDRAIRQPWRSACSYLLHSYGEPETWPDLPLLDRIPSQALKLWRSMVRQGVNTVQTSSCGRLFDAVAALLGLREETTFEGQAAMELEAAAADGVEDHYPFDIQPAEPWQLDLRATIRCLVADLQRGDIPRVIAAKFHNTVAEMIVEVCRRLRRAESVRNVCLSGGAFQNARLLSRARRRLQATGFTVWVPSKVPVNDGGISLGQAAIAHRRSAAQV
jgi:hydrogenase maturation protein HypF